MLLYGGDDPRTGYRALLLGLRGAKEQIEAGEPWGERLVGMWRVAIDVFTDRYGVPQA